MNNIVGLQKTPITIKIANGLQIVCFEGLKLRVIENCLDEHYLHELTYHWRTGLIEKKLKIGTIVNVEGYWTNFNGSYIKCEYNGEVFDINPKYLSTILE